LGPIHTLKKMRRARHQIVYKGFWVTCTAASREVDDLVTIPG
jgi:hypothetical protein